MRIGDLAPDFELLDQYGKAYRLSRSLGQSGTILIFYPYDQSPVCTRQLCAINQELSQFARSGLTVLGVNNAAAETHRRFSDRHYLSLPLLSDGDYSVSRLYNALLEIGPIKAIRRTVVGIDRHMTIRLFQRGFPSNQGLIAQLGPGLTAD